ncbi:MAG: hypothetical protein PHN88_02230 [Ignavibacteria bacterium]|nr:hypothetical protein [Ignavibacteria bacterium]
MKKAKNNFVDNSVDKTILLIKHFCEHLKKGYSAKSFPEMDYKDILEQANKLDEQNNNDTLRQLIENAHRQSRLYWEKLGVDAAHIDGKGENKSTGRNKFNSSVWIFTMRTRFGWKDSEPEPESLFPKEMVVRLTTNS